MLLLGTPPIYLIAVYLSCTGGGGRPDVGQWLIRENRLYCYSCFSRVYNRALQSQLLYSI
jgi:hypothetical protein